MSEYDIVHQIIGIGFKLHLLLRVEHLNTESNHIHLLTDAFSQDILTHTDKIAELFLGRNTHEYIDIQRIQQVETSDTSEQTADELLRVLLFAQKAKCCLAYTQILGNMSDAVYKYKYLLRQDHKVKTF